MKVSVYKAVDGEMSILIQSAPGKGKPPVLLQGVTRQNLKGGVLAAVEGMRGPKQPKPG